MHQNVAFLGIKFQNFLGRGYMCSLPRLYQIRSCRAPGWPPPIKNSAYAPVSQAYNRLKSVSQFYLSKHTSCPEQQYKRQNACWWCITQGAAPLIRDTHVLKTQLMCCISLYKEKDTDNGIPKKQKKSVHNRGIIAIIIIVVVVILSPENRSFIKATPTLVGEAFVFYLWTSFCHAPS